MAVLLRVCLYPVGSRLTIFLLVACSCFLPTFVPSLSPLNLYKGTPAQKKKLELAEVKNGRLAMIGIGGVIHSNFIYHQPIVSQLTHWVPITQALK